MPRFRVYATCDIGEPALNRLRERGYEVEVYRKPDPPPKPLIIEKVRSAVTDSGAEVRRAPDKEGISNLIEILAAVRGVHPEEVEREFDGSGYGAFKQAVADAVIEYLAPVRERYDEIRSDQSALERILGRGAEKARAIAAGTLADVRQAMGVGPVRRGK